MFSWLRKRYANGPIYNFHRGQILEPGTQNLVFEPGFQLPTFPVAKGVANLQQLRVLQPPQIVQAQSVPVSGIGGVVAGQIALQQLQMQDNMDTLFN